MTNLYFSFSGITNFDLLGDFGKISWLGNFWIVLGYNILFATATAWCLVKKFTATIRHEIYMRFVSFSVLIHEQKDFLFSDYTLLSPPYQEKFLFFSYYQKLNHFSFLSDSNS